MEIPPIASPLPAAPGRAAGTDQAMRATAEAFEAVFLTEMLKHTGINAMPTSHGGGAGEDAFASFLTQEYARLLAARGGLGLADQIFEALKAKADGS
jgi:peptidoglycan hydrolase FlgJ